MRIHTTCLLFVGLVGCDREITGVDGGDDDSAVSTDSGTPTVPDATDGQFPENPDALNDDCVIQEPRILIVDALLGEEIASVDSVVTRHPYTVIDSWANAHPMWLDVECYDRWDWAVVPSESAYVGEDFVSGITLTLEDESTPWATVVFTSPGQYEVSVMGRRGLGGVDPYSIVLPLTVRSD